MAKLFTRALLYSFAIILLGVSSCRKCSDSDCQNGGTCESGKCICPYGYFGYFCELNQSNSQAKGTISFYTNTAIPNTCGYYTITLSGYGNQYITSSSAANCTVSGAAHFNNVSYGTYNYTVYCYNTGAVLNSGSVVLNSSCATKLINSSGVNTGTVAFYTTSSLSTCGYLQVDLGGFGTQYIQSSSNASCNSSNNAIFTNVPYGNYNYSVYCYNTGSLITSGNLNVNSSCVTQQLTSSVSNGQLSFYVQSGSSASNYLPLTINLSNGGGSAVVSNVRTSVPANCTTSGCANFNLQPGTYTATTFINGLGNITLGTYNVTSGNCQKVNIP